MAIQSLSRLYFFRRPHHQLSLNNICEQWKRVIFINYDMSVQYSVAHLISTCRQIYDMEEGFIWFEMELWGKFVVT